MTAANHCPTCGTPGTVQNGEFLPLPPLRIARRYADAEVHDHATSAQVQWLHEHPVLWLRALTQIRDDVSVHIAKDRTDLAVLKPPNGENPSTEYLAAKRAFAARSTGRLHFKRMVEKRIDEVKSLIGSDRLVDRLLVGDLVSILLHIGDMADQDDIGGITDVTRYLVAQLTAAEAVAHA